MSGNKNNIPGFLTLTGTDEITFIDHEGWTFASIQVSSSSTGNLTISSSNTDTIAGRTPGNIVLSAGEALTLGTGKRALHNITLSVASGCTVYLTVSKEENLITGINY